MTPSTRTPSPSTDLPSHYVPVSTALHSPGRQVPTHPLRRHSSASSSSSSAGGGARGGSSPSFDELKQSSSQAWDEFFPLPASSSPADRWKAYRRSGAYLVVLLFLVGIVSTACLGGDGGSAVGKLPSGGFGGQTAHVAVPGGGGAGGASDNVDDAAVAGDADDVNISNEHSAEESGAFADDHSHYHLLSTLTAAELGLEADPARQVVFIGDIHGEEKQLLKLLAKVGFDRSRDLMVQVGDLVAKGPRPLDVLRSMRELGVVACRGNHDQPVIQWRSWFERYLPGVDALEGSAAEQDAALSALVDGMTADQARKIGFPKEWVWEGEHFMIAKEMSRQDYAYLLSLPLQIHIVVHAGLLPYDPAQRNAGAGASMPWQDPALTRLESELALLTQIAPNTDPWTLINMRSVLKDGTVTKDGKAGTPWSDIWNRAMKQCTRSDASSLEADDEEEEVEVGASGDKKKAKKGCFPTNVIYGHAAGRGLDIKPHSFGLDSGCVYGKRLTALVLGGKGGKGDQVMLGEREGRLVSVSC